MTPSPRSHRYCLIGAGYSGLAVAKAFTDLGLDYDHFEATERVGGNWSHGVYDSTHMISARTTTQYIDYPMPRDYPDFPSGAQMLAYLQDFTTHLGLDRRIEFNSKVVCLEPLDRRGLAGWRVQLADGRVRTYSGVVVANGHFWDKNIPNYPGTFTGKQIHSKDYKRPADLDGPRVLVVGAGNSGCDLAVEAAITFGTSELSMRRGYWFLPKTVLGIPSAELEQLLVFPPPKVVEQVLYRGLVALGFGRFERYGLPRPTHGVLEQDITVNSQMPYFLQHGRIKPRPQIARFDGKVVHFTDGTCGEYDTIIWATGFHIRFPFLDEGLLRWEKGQPQLLAHIMPPGLANLYLYGVVNPRAGAGRLLTMSSRALAEVILIQERLPLALVDLLQLIQRPDANTYAGGPKLRWQVQRMLPMIRLLHTACGLLASARDVPAVPEPRSQADITGSPRPVSVVSGSSANGARRSMPRLRSPLRLPRTSLPIRIARASQEISA